MANLDSLQTERYLILHADDFGMCHSTNRAVLHLLEQRAISSATLMVPCPWALEAARAAASRPALDVGIHLTLTSEWPSYKWGPVSRSGNVDTLVDDYGHFPADPTYVIHADLEQIREELVAQIETAIRLGVDPTHLDTHMGTLHYHLDLYLELAEKYDLPFRFMAGPPRFEVPAANVASVAQKAKEKGIVHPNEVLMLPFYYPEKVGYETVKKTAVDLIKSLRPGVTELLFHPSLDTDELKAITDTWAYRRFEYDVFLDPDVQEMIRKEGIRIIGWRELRDLQRKR